jgi:hypothetical protein
MSKGLLFFSLLIPLFIISSDNSGAQDASSIHPYLKIVMNASTESELIDVYVVLKERLNYSDLHNQTQFYSRKERRAEVVRILKEFAAVSQSEIKTFLIGLESQNRVSNIQYNWAINVISFKAVKSAILEIASEFSNIESIHLTDNIHPKN